jgi:cell division protein FtsQ
VLALERALALDRAEDMLERDVAALDMRYARRPTLRLNPDAMDELRRIRALERGATTQ